MTHGHKFTEPNSNENCMEMFFFFSFGKNINFIHVKMITNLSLNSEHVEFFSIELNIEVMIQDVLKYRNTSHEPNNNDTD